MQPNTYKIQKKIEQHVTDSQGNLQNRNISSDIESIFSETNLKIKKKQNKFRAFNQHYEYFLSYLN